MGVLSRDDGKRNLYAMIGRSFRKTQAVGTVVPAILELLASSHHRSNSLPSSNSHRLIQRSIRYTYHHQAWEAMEILPSPNTCAGIDLDHHASPLTSHVKGIKIRARWNGIQGHPATVSVNYIVFNEISPCLPCY